MSPTRNISPISSIDDQTVQTTNSTHSASPVNVVSLELEAARHRYEIAKKWEASATNILMTAQRDVNNARSEMSDAAAYLKSIEQRLGVANHQNDSSSASVVSKTSIDVPWTPALTVTGSDVPEINGTYTQCGYFDFVPKYIKITDCDGKQQVFMIFRCKVSETAKRWYISIGSPENGVYFTGGKEGSRRPPVKGWVNIATRAPESKLKVKSNL
ncbi:hypothetical protein HJC23_012458 [Cyclotella cryptica]|uniref:Uncharacterized protein n=1 Tax=Cyclotella cryptica TaxID=29204 RepID=A0ABD3P609_9STRA|eukprot:CCRYP_017477-RA/>CCRYP_017477-RA protein AED:0.10 eAED:0.10 QI:0/-1/0/1/-1/1/1/0/213